MSSADTRGELVVDGQWRFDHERVSQAAIVLQRDGDHLVIDARNPNSRRHAVRVDVLLTDPPVRQFLRAILRKPRRPLTADERALSRVRHREKLAAAVARRTAIDAELLTALDTRFSTQDLIAQLLTHRGRFYSEHSAVLGRLQRAGEHVRAALDRKRW